MLCTEGMACGEAGTLLQSMSMAPGHWRPNARSAEVLMCPSESSCNEDGNCTEAAVALGAVAEKALIVPEAAAALIGSKLDDKAMDDLATAASDACRPIDDKRGTKEYRIKVAGVLAKRAAAIAADRAGA